MEVTNKLFRVTLRGMTHQIGGNGMCYGIAYVIADNLSSAYEKVRHELDKNDIGSSSGRELDKIELLAEDTDYPAVGYKLYL